VYASFNFGLFNRCSPTMTESCRCLCATRYWVCSRVIIRRKKNHSKLKSNVSLLSEISVYTYEGEKPLAEIMQTIADKEKKSVS
jgi:hypothetical protein